MESRVRLSELFLDVLEPGVAGVSEPWRAESSEFCRNRLRPSRSPKLLRPVADDELLTVSGGPRSSMESRLSELSVDDLPRAWRPRVPAVERVGDERPEFRELGRKKAEAGEGFPFWKSARAGDKVMLDWVDWARLGVVGRDGVGVCCPSPTELSRLKDVHDDDILGNSSRKPLSVDVREGNGSTGGLSIGVVGRPFCGKCEMGKRGWLLLFLRRRGRRKKVVVVWTVCVVVVVLP